MACIDSSIFTSCISTNDVSGSQTLKNIAMKLQLYKPPKTDQNYHGDENGTRYETEQFSSCVWKEKRAAVLICIFEGFQGELRVILTKRSMKLSSYPGDVALPGGKTDETDINDSATALREAYEEIGLHSNIVQVVANLEPFIIPLQNNLLKVIPVIGLLSRIEDFKPAPNVDEVDAIFDVPLEMFLEKQQHRFEEREWMGLKYIAHNFEFKSEKHQEVFEIKGLTASILVKTASIIYQKSPSFEQQHHHLPDFQDLEKHQIV